MSSPNVSFATIPASIRKPGTYMEFNTALAVRNLPSNQQRLLIVAQRTAAGSAAAGTAVEVYSDDEARALFGNGSHAHLMVRAALRANRYARIRVLALADAAGATASTYTDTLSGTATSAGTAWVRIGAETIEVNVASGAAANAVGPALQAALAARADLPFTASVAGAVITLTARNGGTVSAGIAVSVGSTATGLSANVASTATGANDPDLAVALAAVFAADDEILVWPYATQAALTTLRTHLRDRSSAIEQRGAIGVYALTSTLSAATTLAGQINEPRITGCLLPGTRKPGFELAAAYAAVIASEEDPARPLNTLELTSIDVPALASRLTRTEQEAALANGVTPLDVGPGERVQIVRAITTYTTNAGGSADVSLLDLTTMRTLDYVRRACRERIALRFPRDKLSARTAARVRSELYDVLTKLEELDIVEQVDANKDGLIVERDGQDSNRLNARIPTDVVNGLHVFAGRIDLLL